MAINITVNNKQIKEDIKVTSIVRSNNEEESDDNDIYMVVRTHVGMYALLGLNTGVCYGPHQYLADLIDDFDLILVTNSIDIVLNNPIVDI